MTCVKHGAQNQSQISPSTNITSHASYHDLGEKTQHLQHQPQVCGDPGASPRERGKLKNLLLLNQPH